MYILTCPGGFPIPAKKGKFEIYGFCATVNDATAASSFALVDDADIKDNVPNGYLLSSLSNKPGVLINMNGIADLDAILSGAFPEPIKTRNGLSVYAVNLLPGSVCVYIR